MRGMLYALSIVEVCDHNVPSSPQTSKEGKSRTSSQARRRAKALDGSANVFMRNYPVGNINHWQDGTGSGAQHSKRADRARYVS
eukprot:363918-Chlamydomonas_euryale.AAC.12